MHSLAASSGVSEHFDFHSWVYDRGEMEALLGRCAVGVALYQPDPLNFTYYADPTKPKDYIGLGLPVVITDVPAIAQEVESAAAGVIVPYDSGRVAEVLIALLCDDALYRRRRDAATSMARQFDWSTIFAGAFARLRASRPVQIV